MLYRVLIALVIGGMLTHNAVIVSYYVRKKAAHERLQPTLRRFQRGQVVQHAVLLLAFGVLATTGFALAYPDIWWSRWLLAIGLTEPLRRWLHRVAAVTMFGAALYHGVWLRTPYGRSELLRLVPRLRDLR